MPYGDGHVLGQPRHCICTNGLCGLSAIAEFLVSVGVSMHLGSGLNLLLFTIIMERFLGSFGLVCLGIWREGLERKD